MLTLYRLRGGADSPQKLGTTAQTPRTNATPAVSAAHFQSTCKSDISNPKSAKKPQRVSWQITFEIDAQKEFMIRASQAPASRPRSQHKRLWRQALRLALSSRRHISVVKTAVLGMRECQTESAPLIQCEGVTKAEGALPDESLPGISVK